MGDEIKSVPGLVNYFNAREEAVTVYFEHLPDLATDYPLDVALAYVFARLELGQNMALYCGVVKIHRANAELARNAVNTHHMSREQFVALYNTVFKVEIPADALNDLQTAESVRDRVMHGKDTDRKHIRNAIARVLDFAEAINDQLNDEHNIKPFGKLQGFSGRAKKLNKETTRFVLKGMGFGIA